MDKLKCAQCALDRGTLRESSRDNMKNEEIRRKNNMTNVAERNDELKWGEPVDRQKLRR